jgi:hypothetical protein
MVACESGVFMPHCTEHSAAGTNTKKYSGFGHSPSTISEAGNTSDFPIPWPINS